MEVNALNFNQAYPKLINAIMREGNKVSPRGKETKEIRPVTVVVENPEQHLVNSSGRPINVAFALAEVLWILGGRDDVKMLEFYNSNIKQFSDDGVSFNAAYGYRMRRGHGFDQIADVVGTLKDDPDSRQAVINIWHPVRDRGWIGNPTDEFRDLMGVKKRETKDRACNTQAYLIIREGKLEWAQLQRSNDAIWGTPYNWMQWSHVQRWVAGLIGVPCGKFTHFINSLHIYEPFYEEARSIHWFDLYRAQRADHSAWSVSEEALEELLQAETEIREAPSLPTLPILGGYAKSVLGVLSAHRAYREGDDELALYILGTEAGPIYGPAQASFYWHWRWHKTPWSIGARINNLWSGIVADWITKPYGQEAS